ncbi:MAG: hypothetical protein II943_04780 [Victivallales bacterium]|nr:hypothetical protein [Victivallales bacterium]
MSFSHFGHAAEEPLKIRPLHYISTDKPIYRLGETVYLRDVILDAQTNYPIDTKNFVYEIKWKIIGPKGDEVFSAQNAPGDSVGSLNWTVDENLPGGIYTVRVENVVGGGAPAERKFEVKTYRVPRIKSQIEFMRRGYLPGQEVTAVVKFERAEGGFPENAVVEATALVDGEKVFSDSVSAVNGMAKVKFMLPEKLAEGDGTLAFIIQDGGVVETAAKTIPILLDNYTVDFYPEGGDLIAGVPNRIYIEARQRNGKGADFAGKVVDAAGNQVVDFATRFDGRGIFELTPAEGEAYKLVVVNETTGQVREFALPMAKKGALVRALQPAYAFDDELAVEVAATEGTDVWPVKVRLRKRDTDLCSVEAREPGTVKLTADENEGVLIVTVFAHDGQPLAERLLFRRPRYRILTILKGLNESYGPGEKVKLTFMTVDEQGNPMSANVGFTVTDASVLEMVDRREQAPRLPEMVYLENEVRDLADAADYFNPDDPDAEVKIDLLLGTQGWRRFAEAKLDGDVAVQDALRRALGLPEVVLRPFMPPMVYEMPGAAAGGRKGALAMGHVVENAPMMQIVEEDGFVEEVEREEMRNGAPPPVPEAEKGAADAGDPAVAQARAMAFDVVDPVGVREAKQLAPARRPARRVWVREYAHKAREGRQPNDRVDFTETIYWTANTKTDPRTGKCEVVFELPDTIGTFRIFADSFGSNGALGEYAAELKCVQPFYAEAKLPTFVTEGDTFRIPVTLANNTAKSLYNANVAVDLSDNLALMNKNMILRKEGVLAPGGRNRVMVEVMAKKNGPASVTVRAVAGGYSDQVKRDFTVVSRLFPFAGYGGGKFSSGHPLVLEMTVPDAVENGSQQASIQVYTSPAATLEAALNALLRNPHGCFEQTSSTNYPLVMAQQYFMSHSGIDSAKIAQAQKLLDEGYKKLVSFECSEKGYEWFGDNPGHEALSAYGLMEFADMAKVMPVDEAMVANTRQWLMGRRDGEGAFLRNEKSLDSFGRAPAPTTNAYILWALLESGEKPADLEKEIAMVAKQAAEAEDDYLKALAANILFLAGQLDGARKFADVLVKDQNDDGTMAKLGATITCSGGDAQKLECAALAALAWVRCGNSYVVSLERTMKYLAASCQAGRFGSTQSTVLVLKAINAYDQQFAKPLKAGNIQLFVDGEPFGDPIAFTEESKGIIRLPDCGLALMPGKHSIELRMTDGSELSASIEITGLTEIPDNAGSIALTTELNQIEVREGEPVQLKVTVKNTAAEDAAMTLAVVAIPGGLQLRTAQLQELVDANRIAAYELWDNAVVLYWRGLPAGGEATVPLSLTAEIPGNYTAAASRAYLYYTDEAKQYVPGVDVNVTVKPQ